MNEQEKNDPSVRVNDRRRFDAEGNPRADEYEPSSSSVPSQAREEPREPARSQSAEEIQRLEKELEAARKRIDELARAFQALERDREDFKQRLSRERERVLEVERGNIALIVLDILDELELSLQASGDDGSPLARGVRLIRDNILKKVQLLGIERVDVMDQAFDPNLAEATDTELTTEPKNDQKVVAVVRPGYRLKDRIIRPARVRVARYLSPAQA
jgi:molecular chaperone GrpE